MACLVMAISDMAIGAFQAGIAEAYDRSRHGRVLQIAVSDNRTIHSFYHP